MQLFPTTTSPANIVSLADDIKNTRVIQEWNFNISNSSAYLPNLIFNHFFKTVEWFFRNPFHDAFDKKPFMFLLNIATNPWIKFDIFYCLRKMSLVFKGKFTYIWKKKEKHLNQRRINLVAMQRVCVCVYNSNCLAS